MDKTKNQIISILNSLRLMMKKSSASQVNEVISLEISELYKIIKEKYSEKDQLLDKIYKLILVDEEIQKDMDGVHNKEVMFIEMLEEILECVESEQFDKIKVLFLPYKASMWDSMESIYVAAKQTPGCNVEVMPIPYFNINNEREVISMEYEGECFPEEIKIIDYKSYWLEDENPEVIFIHNPYDDKNLITQIRSDYFSSNLAKYTKHLCYVPYDIANEETFNENLCKMPGIQNAWKVFVQSQTLKKRYEKYNHENKVVCLGSPKIDSMVSGLSYKDSVPKEWSERCNGRQVFMLNTHLSRLMNADALDLTFFNNLIEYLKGHDNIAVIWRPHPLIIQTIKSMNPNALESFQRIVDEFKNLPNGIYDDTTDMHTAIELSDAYFGDGGSLLKLYGATGKPMYLCGGMNESLLFDGGFSTGRINQGENISWAFCKGHNGLYKVDLLTKEVSYVLSLPTENFYEKQLYSDIVEYKNWLYMLPINAKDIIAINKDTHDIKVIESTIGEREYKYVSKMVKDNYLIITPASNTDAVIIVDMDCQSVEEISLMESYNNEIEKISLAYTLADIKDDKIYIPSRVTNKVLICTKKEMYWKTIEDSGDGLWQCKVDENGLWILPIHGAYVYRCKHDCEEIVKIDYSEVINNVNIFLNFDRFFERIMDVDTHIWLLPLKAKFFLKIDKNSLEYDVINLSAEVIHKCLDDGKGYFGKPIYEKGYIYLPSYGNNCFAKIDVVNETMWVETFEVKNEIIAEQHKENVEKNEFRPMDKAMYLYTECSFEYFTQIVDKEKKEMQEKRRKIMLDGIENIDGSAGKKIWDYVYNEIIS